MSTILSVLRTLWPPDLANPTLGYKTHRAEYTGDTIRKTLDDLHEHAWWTGMKIVIGGGPGQREFLVTLVDSDGVLSTLRVQSGEAQPFQWALPAHVATARRIELHIVPVLPDPIPFVNVISYFHEMPPLNPETALHFILDDYAVAFSHHGPRPSDVDVDVDVNVLVIPSMHRLYRA